MLTNISVNGGISVNVIKSFFPQLSTAETSVLIPVLSPLLYMKASISSTAEMTFIIIISFSKTMDCTPIQLEQLVLAGY